MNIGILTSKNIPEFGLRCLSPILSSSNMNIRLALVDMRQSLSLKQKLIKNIKRGRGAYVFIMAFKKLFAKADRSQSVFELCNQNDIEILETKDPQSEETIEKLKMYNLDVLILVNGFGFIKGPLLTVTPLGILSYHHGDMRKYRGMPPALWELYNGEKEMGVTVQILGKGLDSGAPVEKKEVEIKRKDTLKSLQQRAIEESVEMMYKALIKLSDNKYKPIHLDQFGKVYTLPNLRQWIILNLKILRRKLS